MNITRDLDFEEKLIERIATREFAGLREGVHCSDLIYCLNKQALRRSMPLPPERHEVLLFSLGWATQRWLTGNNRDEDSKTVDGIIVTMDAILDTHPWELKCTYQSAEKPVEENQNWVRQVMAQCYIANDTIAHLSRLEVMGDWKSVFKPKDYKTWSAEEKSTFDKLHAKPSLHVFKFEFTKAELADNWAWLKSRRNLFAPILLTGKLLPKEMSLPQGQAYECNYCRKEYKDLCLKS